MQSGKKVRKKRKRRTIKTKRKAPYTVITPEYAAKMEASSVTIPGLKDQLIKAILEADEVQTEMIRRAVLIEDRLDVLMRLLGFDVRPHHQTYIDFFHRIKKRGRKYGMLLGPRGSGKSTACDICYAIMRVLQNRNINVLIASRTGDQAKAFLAAIKGNLEKLEKLEIFGKLVGDKWDETAASIHGREVGQKEHTFHIAGADGAVVSKHFELIICDDLVEEKNAKTDTGRETVLRFFYKSLLPCLKAGGEMRVLGTRYHPEDLYGYLQEKDPNFRHTIFVMPGVFDKTTGEYADLIQNDDGSFSLPENATTWDPEGFPVDELLKRREGMPHGDFEAQYQNRIEFLRGDYFTSDWFQYYDQDPAALVEELDLVVWMGVDLAASLKRSADEFAIVVVGITKKTFEIYVLDYIAGRFSFNKQKQHLKDMFDVWDPVRTFVESNAYQSVLESTAKEEFPDVRTLPIWTTEDKITRATAFQLYYERGQVFHRKNRSAKLEGQLTGFPHVKLKDLFDGLYIAVWGAMRGGRRRGRRTEEPGLFGG